MEIITLRFDDGEVIPVEFTRKKMRHIRLRVLSGGRVVVSAPRLTPRVAVLAFLEYHKEWIYKHRTQKGQGQSYIDLPFLSEDGTAYYLGVKRQVRAVLSEKDGVEVAEDEIVVFCRKSLDRKERVYAGFLLRSAMEVFEDAMKRWLPLFTRRGVQPPVVKIRRYRSKWGTCFPTRGEIVMNLHLIKADPSYIDYVMLHEMTHLLYSGHGKAFYAFLLRAMPDAKERRKRLNEGVKE